MSKKEQEPMEMATKPLKEHEWLKNLIGEWKVKSEMLMPDGETFKTHGTASVKSFGDLWVITESRDTFPDNSEMVAYFALGYDVSFKEYRGGLVMTASSHLWKYAGELDAGGKKLTLNCEGPDMVNDGKTAQYREILELVDDNHRTQTSYGQDEKGEWIEYSKADYTRA